jgi:hypothetical protein
MPLTDEQIAMLEQLNESRFPGVWEAEMESLDDIAVVRADNAEMEIETGSDADGLATAHFIAAASWAIPAMIEEIKELRAKLAEGSIRP